MGIENCAICGWLMINRAGHSWRSHAVATGNFNK